MCTDDPVVPIQLLLWAVHTTVTTLTCLAEMISVEELLNQEKLVLTQFYMPYLLVGMFILVFVSNKRSPPVFHENILHHIDTSYHSFADLNFPDCV